MDSSIFMVFTSADQTLPRDRVLDAAGRERFGRFVTGIPFTKQFVNTVSNYPYPYVINGLLWELPPIIPGDAHGVHAYQAGSPRVVEDWQRALDLVVAKQGLHTICFHPHGYCLPEHPAALVDYADRTYGRRVRFLNCREILDRLTTNLLAGTPLRSATGADNGVRLIDVNGDGFLDVVIGNSHRQITRVWQPAEQRWRETPLPVALVTTEDGARSEPTGVRFFTAAPDGRAGLALATAQGTAVWHFENGRWVEQKGVLPAEADGAPLLTIRDGVDRGVRFRDLDGDGYSDLIVNNDTQNAVFLWNPAAAQWRRASFALPAPGCLVDARGADHGLRRGSRCRRRRRSRALQRARILGTHLRRPGAGLGQPHRGGQGDRSSRAAGDHPEWRVDGGLVSFGRDDPGQRVQREEAGLDRASAVQRALVAVRCATAPGYKICDLRIRMAQ